MTRLLLPVLYLVVGLLTTATLTVAVLDRGEEQDLLVGGGHPLHLDHLFALLVVGLWAGRLRGFALWAFPPAFLAGMALGFLLAAPRPVAPVEPILDLAMLAATILLAGAAALDLRPSRPNAIAALGLLGTCHGLSDRVEAGSAEAGPFALGYVVVAATLLGLGVMVGRVSRQGL